MTTSPPSSPPSPDQLHDEQILRFLSGLWRLNRRIKADVIPLLVPFGLDLRLYFILLAIRRGQRHPKTIAEGLDFPASMLSRYLEQLRTLGYTERQLDPADSRRILLQVTPAGHQALDGAMDAIKRNTSKRLSQLDPARLSALLDAIDVLTSLDLPTSPLSPPHPSPAQKETA
ncbi:MarR family winged helix-turn-helix transcriptional regulator [Deinococcus sp. Marseille-Q6407]|uniref:MarR family winged helix-turn-helix transcriptional regulator n=1 Tax=Deinococcus sp. Marseille-Q6407 TaxID=2969223 RepID=UPI0021BFA0F5|nr:winged helix DNA-binding protein [Deinococcus sp. Marseille-Q6407]